MGLYTLLQLNPVRRPSWEGPPGSPILTPFWPQNRLRSFVRIATGAIPKPGAQIGPFLGPDLGPNRPQNGVPRAWILTDRLQMGSQTLGPRVWGPGPQIQGPSSQGPGSQDPRVLDPRYYAQASIVIHSTAS